MELKSVNMGEIIREMRKAKGDTQEALAQAMGLSIQAVSKWETGQSLPDVALLPVIADYFGISIDALFGRREEAVCEEAEASAQENPSSPFPDDGRLRVVQYLGSQMMSAEECTDGREIRLMIEEVRSRSDSACRLDIEIQGGARINGSVNGTAKVSGDMYISGSVNGSAAADGDIAVHGNINGSVRTGGAVTGQTGAATIRVEGIGDSLSGLRSSLSGLGNMVSGMFSGRRSGKSAGARMNAFFSGELPDDEIIRVVQMQGRRVMSAEESRGQRVIRLSVGHLTNPLNVEIYGSAQIEGDIHGNAASGDSMVCGSVRGNASAGDSLSCSDIAGNASAGDGVRCGNVGGSVTAGDGVTCGTVGGSVRAGDSVEVTGDVGGNVTASDSVICSAVQGSVRADSVKYTGAKCKVGEAAGSARAGSMPDVSGYADGALHIVQVMNGEILSVSGVQKGEPVCIDLEDADGISVHVHGDAQIEGGVSGDVRANGSVTCGDVEGDVHAGGQVNCGTVEGDAHAGGQVNCETVEGSVTAGGQVSCAGVEGDVSAGMSVTCADVSGNVTVQGGSDKCTVTCGEVDGDVTAVNAVVTCGGVCGSVNAKGDQPAVCIVSCGGIEGNVSALNANIDCGVESICGDVDARGDEGKCAVSCGGIEGNVTAVNASVNCQDGSVCGNVEARGEQPDKCIVSCGGIEGSVIARNASVSCGGTVCGDVDACGEE